MRPLPHPSDISAEELQTMLGVFAEFERSMIVERVKAGLKRARAEGKVLALRGKGRGMRAIAQELQIGNCTVQRIVSTA